MTTSLQPQGSSRSTRRLFLAGAAGATIAAAFSLPYLNPLAAAQATPTAEPHRRRARREPTHTDVPYVGNPADSQKLDIYLPDADATGPFPLVIWMHGGGWVGGDKRRVGVRYLLNDGYAIASINYRLLDEALPPAQIQDANAAASFLWQEADTYGLDRERFVLAGSSAGGRLASLVGLSTNNDVPEFQADPDVRFAAVIDFFGGVGANQERLERFIEQEDPLSDTEREKIVSVLDTLSYVDKADPPTLIVHGENDRVVPIEDSEALTAALEAAGVPVTFERFPGRGHGMPRFLDAEVRSVVREFLKETLLPM
jgi:acetyl esterase/lipase